MSETKDKIQAAFNKRRSNVEAPLKSRLSRADESRFSARSDAYYLPH